MRLATARDELEPLRDPSISGPDDPRLTILVLARVVSRLGSLELVTPHEIEGLFAADLAYLQDFYGVINFGSQEEYEALVRAQEETQLSGVSASGGSPASANAQPAGGATDGDGDAGGPPAVAKAGVATERSRRHAIEEIPAGGR